VDQSPERPRVAVWRWEWLMASETFIRRQCDSLQRFEAVPMGAVKIASPLVRPTDLIVYASRTARFFWARAFKVLGRGRAVRRSLLRNDVQLVHAHFGPDGAVLVPTVRSLGIPLIVTLHGYDVTPAAQQKGWREAQYLRRLKHLFRYATTIIAVSEAVAAQARRLGAPEDTLTVHYMGISVGPLPAAPTDKTWDVLFVGRLVEKKGVDDLIRAIAVLNGRGRTVRCAIAGSGPLQDGLVELAAELHAPLTFLGHQSPEEVKDLMASSTVLAVPSKTASNGDMEGLPTVMMEGLAAGIPVAATRHSGIPEVIVDGESGLLSDEGDYVTFADHLEQLLDDAELRARLAEHGRRRVEQDFNIDRQSAKLEDLYAQALAVRP
jgi:colanic acid/amylovoran biosynthesis glycosyltransferase